MLQKIKAYWEGLTRQGEMLMLAGIGLLVLFFSPLPIGGMLYKSTMIIIAAVLGYYLDRAAFPYARPHRFLDSLFGAGAGPAMVDLARTAMIRRAIIIAASMIAMAFITT